MALFLKRLKSNGRETWLYYPDIPNRSPFKVASITILREGSDRESVVELLDMGLAELAEEKKLILSFPNPTETGWNWRLNPELADDAAALCSLQEAMNQPEDRELAVNHIGIPTLEAMLSTWHPMNDTRYWIGIGEGASMAYTMAALKPETMAAVLGIGGSLAPEAVKRGVKAPVPVNLIGTPSEICDYFCDVNEAKLREENEDCAVYSNPVNPSQYVKVLKKSVGLDKKLIREIWDKSFRLTRRLNTGGHGDCAFRTDLKDPGFEWFLEDTSLEGKPHTWLVHVPEKVRRDSHRKVPVMFFYHGGSDNPEEAAEMSKFHEVGEKEGFITVYPWGSNRAGWNCSMEPEEEEDAAFCRALILHMIKEYPIDPARVYLSGFSNGAAMAQTVAMLYPELVAAICHIDSNWPGSRFGYSEVDYGQIRPMALALKKKEKFDYRMPVWYTYGTREASYPVYRGCTQQHQYDFWKMYNHIEVRPTPPKERPDPSGCGVQGDVTEKLGPYAQYPNQYYMVQRFYTTDDVPENYYNYVMMHDKGHEVAPMDAYLGWNYVKQFRRNEDGSVGRV